MTTDHHNLPVAGERHFLILNTALHKSYSFWQIHFVHTASTACLPVLGEGSLLCCRISSVGEVVEFTWLDPEHVVTWPWALPNYKQAGWQNSFLWHPFFFLLFKDRQKVARVSGYVACSRVVEVKENISHVELLCGLCRLTEYLRLSLFVVLHRDTVFHCLLGTNFTN